MDSREIAKAIIQGRRAANRAEKPYLTDLHPNRTVRGFGTVHFKDNDGRRYRFAEYALSADNVINMDVLDISALEGLDKQLLAACPPGQTLDLLPQPVLGHKQPVRVTMMYIGLLAPGTRSNRIQVKGFTQEYVKRAHDLLGDE